MAAAKPKRTKRVYIKVDPSQYTDFKYEKEPMQVPHYIDTHSDYVFCRYNLGEQRTLLGIAMTDGRLVAQTVDGPINRYAHYTFTPLRDGSQCLTITPHNNADSLSVRVYGGKSPCVLDGDGCPTKTTFATVEDFTRWVLVSLEYTKPGPVTDYETTVKEGAEAAIAALAATELATVATVAPVAPVVQYRLVPVASS